MSVAVVLSGNDGPPASPVYVGGSGFGAFEGVDIYFDTVALGLAGTDASGSFGGVLTHVPAGAEPGIHLISAAGRESGLFAQAAFTVNTDWAQIGYSARHSGWNPHENTLQPDNVSAIDLAWTFSASFISSPVVVGRLAYIADGYGTVYALDAGTGAQVWTNPTGAGYAASSPAVADGWFTSASTPLRQLTPALFTPSTRVPARSCGPSPPAD